MACPFASGGISKRRFMHSYRCYLLDTNRRITTVEIVECADDNDAKLRSREICSANQSCHGVEVWDNARRVYCYPDILKAPAEHPT
jgi:hypothetical protein